MASGETVQFNLFNGVLLDIHLNVIDSETHRLSLWLVGRQIVQPESTDPVKML